MGRKARRPIGIRIANLKSEQELLKDNLQKAISAKQTSALKLNQVRANTSSARSEIEQQKSNLRKIEIQKHESSKELNHLSDELSEIRLKKMELRKDQENTSQQMRNVEIENKELLKVTKGLKMMSEDFREKRRLQYLQFDKTKSELEQTMQKFNEASQKKRKIIREFSSILFLSSIDVFEIAKMN